MGRLVVGLGEILWDMLPDGKKSGGAPANFIYHASQSGYESYMVSAVGGDDLGRELLEVLQDKISLKYIQKSVLPTGTVSVKLDDNGIPQYEICRDVAWDDIRFTPDLKLLAGHTQTVVFGSLAQRETVSRTTIMSFLDAMPEHKETLKVFDINLRQSFYSVDIIEESLKKCNVLKINDDEFYIITEILNLKYNTFSEGCREIIERYDLKIVILTCGAVSSTIFTKEYTSFLETPKVKVDDTVGAGDSFTASFCTSLMSGKSLRESHIKAVQTAAYVCTQKGAMPLMIG